MGDQATVEDRFSKDNSRNDMQKLFLLEVLVDNLFIQVDSSSPNLSKDMAANMEDTCVMFQFLHYPPLVVCESDFIGTAMSGKDTSHITFKSGKSCFFSLRTPKGPILPVPFDVKVSVIRKMKEGVLPDKLELGKTSIDLGENFTELLKQNTDENECESLPMSKIKKGTFDIKDDAGRQVGTLTAFLRLSCFGKLIITQFSLNKEDEKKYLFKGTDLKEFCKAGLGQTFPDRGEGQNTAPGVAKTDRPSDLAHDSAKQQGGPISQWNQSQAGTIDPRKGPSPYCPCGPNNAPLTTRGPTDPWKQGQVDTFDPRMRGPLMARGPASYGNDILRPPVGTLDPWKQGQQDTFDPRMRGPLIPRNQPGTYGQVDPWKQNQFDPRRGPQQSSPYGTGGGRLCDCPYPVSPNVMANYAKRNTSQNMNLAPGEVGLQDDQVIFQLPLKRPGDPITERDQQMDSQVYYKLTSAEETKDGVQKNTVNVKSDDIPGMVTKPAVSPVSGLPVDDGHDVFLLKIGKKCEGDMKRNLELELRTPKMKEPKPAMSDRDTQYLESDIPKSSGKKSKDKGKGKGKGGKKSKGKK